MTETQNKIDVLVLFGYFPGVWRSHSGACPEIWSNGWQTI